MYEQSGMCEYMSKVYERLYESKWSCLSLRLELSHDIVDLYLNYAAVLNGIVVGLFSLRISWRK